MSLFSCLGFETREHLAVVSLNRPQKRNAFNLAMLHELSQAFTLVEQDPALFALLLVAEGEHFTGGLDLAEVGPAVLGGAPLFPEGGIDPLGVTGPRLRKPIITAVQGICFTIGVELLLASDLRLAAHGTRFAQMEVQRGIIPFGGGTWRWPQVAGWGNAMRHILTGDPFDANEALRIGLVSELTEPSTLRERALALAERVVAQAPLATQAILRNARLSLQDGPDSAAAAIVGEAQALMVSEDATEGKMSFLERRPARFRGR